MKIFRLIFNVLKFTVIFLLTAEILFQIVGYQDNDKIYFFGSYPLIKTRTIKEWRSIYNQINADTTSYFKYDPTLGWVHRPKSTSQDGLMHFNSAGIRSLEEYNKEPSDSVVRIVLLGSSVMLSAEVPDSNSLGFYLKETLEKQGKQVEVLNMAVGSYGNDQALLKWLYFAKDYQPDLVIQGVHLSECWLNLNIFKYCSHPPTGILFSKPRAIANNDSLLWMNLPTVKPEHLVDSIIINFEKQPFYEYEYFKSVPRFGQRLQDNFYINQVYQQYIKIDLLKDRHSQKEGLQLMNKLVHELKTSVETDGAEHVLLHLVSYHDLEDLDWNTKLLNPNIWSQLISDKNYLSTYSTLSDASLRKLFVSRYASHYSEYGNQLIAEQLAEYLLKKGLIVKKTME